MQEWLPAQGLSAAGLALLSELCHMCGIAFGPPLGPNAAPETVSQAPREGVPGVPLLRRHRGPRRKTLLPRAGRACRALLWRGQAWAREACALRGRGLRIVEGLEGLYKGPPWLLRARSSAKVQVSGRRSRRRRRPARLQRARPRRAGPAAGTTAARGASESEWFVRSLRTAARLLRAAP